MVLARGQVGAAEGDVDDLVAARARAILSAGSSDSHGTSLNGSMVPCPMSGAQSVGTSKSPSTVATFDLAVVAAEGLERDDDLAWSGRRTWPARPPSTSKFGVEHEDDRVGIVGAEEVEEVVDADVLGRQAGQLLGRQARVRDPGRCRAGRSRRPGRSAWHRCSGSGCPSRCCRPSHRRSAPTSTASVVVAERVVDDGVEVEAERVRRRG